MPIDFERVSWLISFTSSRFELKVSSNLRSGNSIVKVEVNHNETKVSVEGNQDIDVLVNGKSQLVKL